MLDFTKLKLGKLAPVYDVRALRLANYTRALPPAPAALDLSGPVTGLGMMMNDSLGDCTCAAVGHMIQVWTANASAQVILPDSEVLALYERACGYVPGDPSTDQGGMETEVLKYWRDSGIFPGHTLAGWCSVQPGNHQEVMQCLQLFGAVYIGVALPTTAQSQVGGVWDVVENRGPGTPGSWGGHAVPVVAYDGEGLTVITWGAYQKMTWAFWDAYVDEAHGPLSADWIERAGKSPTGMYWTKLKADLAAL